MKKNTIITLLIIIAVVIVGGILLTSSDTTTPTDNSQATTTDDMGGEENRITAQHQYNEDEGTHIVAGEIDLPTPCHLLEHEVEMTGEGDTQEAIIHFESRVEDTDEVCAQVITPQRFKVTFEAPEDVEISATHNGEDTTLNLVPVPEGENLEEFEVFMKG